MGGSMNAQSEPIAAAAAAIGAGTEVTVTLQPPDGKVYLLDRITWGGQMLPHVFTMEIGGNTDIAQTAPATITEDWQNLGLPQWEGREDSPMVDRDTPLVFKIKNVDVVVRTLEYTIWARSINSEKALAIRRARL